MRKRLDSCFLTLLDPITEIEVPLELWDKLPKYVYKGLDPEIKILDTYLANSLKKIQELRLDNDYPSWMYVVELDDSLYIRMDRGNETVPVIVFKIIEFCSSNEYQKTSYKDLKRFNTLNYHLNNISAETTEHHLNELKKLLDTSN